MYEPGDEEGEGVTWERTIVSEPSYLIIDGLGADQLGKVINCGGQLVRSTIILRTYREQAGSAAEADEVESQVKQRSHSLGTVGGAQLVSILVKRHLGPSGAISLFASGTGPDCALLGLSIDHKQGTDQVHHLH